LFRRQIGEIGEIGVDPPDARIACWADVGATSRNVIERLYVRKLPNTKPPSEPVTPPAFTSALMAAQRPLYAFVRGLVGDPEQARDITQDVFHDAWRAFTQGAPPFEIARGTMPDEAELRRWLFHAAYCDAANVHRRRQRIRWESLDAPPVGRANDPAQQVSATPFEDVVAEHDTMRAALATLAPEDVACLLLNVIQGFSAVEIAQIVGVSPDASKKRLSRAKQRLRAAYTAQADEPRATPTTQEPRP